MKSRVRHLELQLGLETLSSSRNDSDEQPLRNRAAQAAADVSSRVQALERQCAALAQQSSAVTDWKEIDALMEELSPGTALTHQKQIMAPILYRRAEVLAASARFKADMEQVAQILHLLLISAKPAAEATAFLSSSTRSSTATSTTTITEQQVVHAPILMTDYSNSEMMMSAVVEQERLDALSTTVVDLQARIQRASAKLDRILDNYASLVAAVSETLVLADEEITLRREPQQTA